jgi:LPS sulfotransferase NodH
MNFLIVAMARTGSSHLVNMLSGHPEIFCHGNVFGKQMLPLFYPKDQQPPKEELRAQKAQLRKLRAGNPRAFLDKVLATGHGRPHVGFKVFRGQNDSLVKELLGDSSIRKIILFRSNVLANYSSRLVARKTGKWDAKKGQIAPPPPKVAFVENEFIEFHDSYISYYDEIMKATLLNSEPFFVIQYEELNNQVFTANLIRFIGADANKPIKSEVQRREQVKQNSSDIVARFSNRAEVEAFLRKQGLEHWQQEGEVSLVPIGDTGR